MARILPAAILALLFPFHASIAEVTSATSDQAANAAATKPKTLELSVSRDDGKMTALVVWLLKDDKLSATRIGNKFSFEWLNIPADAKAFLVVPDLDKTTFETTTFVELAPLKGPNIYVSLRPDGTSGSFITINKDSVASDKGLVRTEPRQIPKEDGWVYIGSWDNATSQWNTVFWLSTKPEEPMSKRRAVSTSPPEGLVGQSPTLDFPLAYRRGPSTEFEQIQPGWYLAPGTSFKFSEVSRIPYPSHHEVWAKISISPTPPSRQ
jgi:hypothetical protein